MPDDAAFTWDTPVPPRPRVVPAAEPPEVAPEAHTPPPPEPVPDSHLLVPRDAWDKILAQLGNLHDAGQQLAVARERAAKAETEVAFLRERLAELRERLDPPEPPPPAEPEPERPAAAEPLTARLTRAWRALRNP